VIQMAFKKSFTTKKPAKSPRRIERVLKKPRPPRRAREWFSALTNKYGYWDARFKFKQDKQGRKQLHVWLPQTNGSMEKVVVEISSSNAMANAVPVKAFYHKKGKHLVVITRAESKPVKMKGQRIVRVDFRAHLLDPFEKPKVSASNRFLLASYNYFPDHRVVIGGDFRWFPETVESKPSISFGPEIVRSKPDLVQTSGQTVPPSFIAGKAFGLAVNHLRDLDHAKQGITKIFGHIDPSHRSMKFAKKRGFRKLNEEEKAFLKKVDPGFFSHNDNFKHMVRDFKP